MDLTLIVATPDDAGNIQVHGATKSMVVALSIAARHLQKADEELLFGCDDVNIYRIDTDLDDFLILVASVSITGDVTYYSKPRKAAP